MLQGLKDLQLVKSKKQKIKALAMDLKGDVNHLIWDYSLVYNMTEFKTLYNLVHYIDTFILNCFDRDGNLINKKWIQRKLIASVIYLGSSNHIEFHRLMTKVIELENMIYEEEIKTNGNKNSNS